MSTTGISPAGLKRLENLSAFWTPRIKAVDNDADLAKVMFDRAKAAARRAQKAGDPTAMHQLAELLSQWSAGKERVEATRHTG